MRVSIGGEMTALPGLPDLAVPRLTAETSDPELPYDLEMEIALVHGRPMCVSLCATRRADGPPVTRQGLNSLPVNRLVRQAAATGMLRKVNQGPGFVAYDWPASPEAAEAALRELTPKGGRPAGSGAQNRMHQAVQMYRDLIAAKDSQPTKTISKKLHVSVSYASQLLTRARKQGLLGPAPSGRAGEDTAAR